MTITAKFVGTPRGGDLDNPFPAGQPEPGERVALFAYEVKSVDSDPDGTRSYHVAPATSASSGPLGPASVDPQGDTVQWLGCGTGTVVGVDGLSCEVEPDDPGLG